MLENKTARQDRQGVAVDRFRIDRDHWHAEKIADHTEKTLLVHFSGVEYLRRPRAAVHILRQLRRFLARRHTAREQKIDD